MAEMRELNVAELAQVEGGLIPVFPVFVLGLVALLVHIFS